MSKRTEIATTRVSPAWLVAAAEQDDSLKAMQEHRVLPRIKVIQGLSKKELRDQFGQGAVVLNPLNTLIATPGSAFRLVPVFFFSEYVAWNDRKDTKSPAIHARTYDPASEVARRSKKRETREEPYEGGYVRRYVEQLTFPSLFYMPDHPLHMVATSLVFARGEFFTGENFINAIHLRKVGTSTAPLWSQVWEFRSAERERKGNQWWGIDFGQPTDGEPFIQENEVDAFSGFYKEMKKLQEAQRLSVDMSDADEQDITQLEELS